MTKNQPPSAAEKALTSTERHARDLKAVNEKLADLVASLRDQKQRLSVYSHSGSPPTATTGEVRVESRPAEPILVAELSRMRDVLQSRDEERARLRERLAEIEAENRRVCEEFVEIQQQNAELVGLYAAIERLHGAPTRSDVLTAIQEIVVNVVGSEEFALFELNPDGQRLVPALAFGIDVDDLEEIAIGSGTIGRAAAEAWPRVADEPSAPVAREGSPVMACVPLRLGDKVTGALAIYSLLRQKPALTDFDRELFSLLERHAALALQFRTPEQLT